MTTTIPGIDPKIDIAFKKVFGSEPWRDLTASLINAVLEPPPQQRLVDVELLNPYSEKMTLDDKLSILDIKGRDQQGRLYNLEMQMLATTSLGKGIAIDGQGRLSWSPTAAQAGGHMIGVTVTDNLANATRQYSVTVTRGTNAAPQITSSAPASVLAGQEYRYLVQATDADGDPIQYQLDLGPADMTIDAATGLLRWPTGAADAGTSPTVRVKAIEKLPDGQGGFTLGQEGVQSFAIDVTSTAANRDPQITSQPARITLLDRLYGYNPTATDPEGGALLWSLVEKPDGMLIDQATGRLRWQPTAAQLGAHAVTLRVSDLAGCFDTQSFTVTVRAVNLGPQITSVPTTVAWSGTLYTYAVQATDPEGDPIQYVGNEKGTHLFT